MSRLKRCLKQLPVRLKGDVIEWVEHGDPLHDLVELSTVRCHGDVVDALVFEVLPKVVRLLENHLVALNVLLAANESL